MSKIYRKGKLYRGKVRVLSIQEKMDKMPGDKKEELRLTYIAEMCPEHKNGFNRLLAKGEKDRINWHNLQWFAERLDCKIIDLFYDTTPVSGQE